QSEELLQQIRDFSEEIASKNDISRKQHAQALINYEAQVRLKEYELEEQKMYMAAPGSPEQIDAGLAIAKDVSANQAKQIVDSAMQRGLPVGQVSGIGSQIELINYLKPYLNNGDVNSIRGLDISSILQEDTVDPATVNRLIDTLTNPFPQTLSVSRDENGEIAPTPAEMKTISDRVLEQAMMSVAVNALGELGAKRFVNPDTNKSLMQIMHEESIRRFQNVNWYKNIGISSQEALLRELAHMEAFRLRMQYEHYRLQEQTVSLLSALVASQAKMTSMIQMLNETMMQASQNAQDAMPANVEDIDLE
ncbi:MAG TPA: hypothetical protein VFP93_01005, partial [Gammaproteobacteria bacterium]|nr:hypothetical protein [Gammaproteobacteria bacterium]